MMTNFKIGLIGYGAIGKQVRNLLLQNGFLEKNIYCFDDQINLESNKEVYPFWSFTEKKYSEFYFIPTIGYLSTPIKRKVLEVLIDKKLNIYSFIHPTSFVNPTAKIGRGVVVYPQCNIDQNVVIKDGVLLNNSCTISHNSVIGKNCYISPGVVTSGFVIIEDDCFIGSGTVISNMLTIGAESRVGVGTCVTKGLPKNSVAIGNPMQIKNNIKLL